MAPMRWLRKFVPLCTFPLFRTSSKDVLDSPNIFPFAPRAQCSVQSDCSLQESQKSIKTAVWSPRPSRTSYSLLPSFKNKQTMQTSPSTQIFVTTTRTKLPVLYQTSNLPHPALLGSFGPSGFSHQLKGPLYCVAHVASTTIIS